MPEKRYYEIRADADTGLVNIYPLDLEWFVVTGEKRAKIPYSCYAHISEFDGLTEEETIEKRNQLADQAEAEYIKIKAEEEANRQRFEELN